MLKLQYLATWREELTYLKRPWCWGRFKVGGEGDDRGWDDWMASPTQWTWVWASSGSWWWTGKPGLMQFMGLQRVGHDWVTELNWTEWTYFQIRADSCVGAECSENIRNAKRQRSFVYLEHIYLLIAITGIFMLPMGELVISIRYKLSDRRDFSVLFTIVFLANRILPNI